MVEKGESSHLFPTKSLLDRVTTKIMNGSYALCFATGTMENRDDAVGTHEIKYGRHIDLKCQNEIESMGIGSTRVRYLKQREYIIEVCNCGRSKTFNRQKLYRKI